MELKQYERASLKYIVVEPDNYDSSREYPLIVLLHGFGSHMGDLAGLSSMIETRKYVYAFPNAPIPIQVGFGSQGYAWAHPLDDDLDGLYQDSEEKLSVFLQDVLSGYKVGSQVVVLGGFSQGGLVCFDFALFLNKPLGGVFPIAGFTRHPKAEVLRCHPCQKKIPILISHGKDDDQIPARASENIYRQLKDQGANVELLIYKGKHKIGIECLRRIKTIIQN